MNGQDMMAQKSSSSSGQSKARESICIGLIGRHLFYVHPTPSTVGVEQATTYLNNSGLGECDRHFRTGLDILILSRVA